MAFFFGPGTSCTCHAQAACADSMFMLSRMLQVVAVAGPKSYKVSQLGQLFSDIGQPMLVSQQFLL